MKPHGSQEGVAFPSRILFVVTSRFAGGAQHALLGLIEHLKSSHECLLAAPATDGNRGFLAKTELHCRHVPFDVNEPADDWGIHLRLGRYLLGCWRTVLLFLRVHPDVTVFFLHHPLAAAAPRFIAALLGRRSILSFRLVMNGLPVGPRRIRLLNWEKRRHQIWMAVSEDNRRKICSDMGLPLEVVRLIYNGIQPLPGCVRLYGEDRRAMRERLGVPPERVVFLFSGRLELRKGCPELLSAAVSLWKDHPNALVVFLGDGPERACMEAEVRAQGAEPGVRFPGHCDHAARFLSVADVYVHPAHYEGLSNAILEAMQMGLPILTTNSSSMPELVSDGVEGMLVPKKDPGALYHAMKRLLLDEPLRERMGHAASKRAQRFPLEATYLQWEEMITDARKR